MSNLVQSLPDLPALNRFRHQLLIWLQSELGDQQGLAETADFTDSRARALLLTTSLASEPEMQQFVTLMEEETAVRLALAELLTETGIESELALRPFPISSSSQAADAAWLPLLVAAWAWKADYPLTQFDPASPPRPHTPAWQLLTHVSSFMRQQQRPAAERARQARRLQYQPAAADTGGTSPPLPPYYRPPIPVRYPEVARETLQVAPDEDGLPPRQQQQPTRGEPIVITSDDITTPPPSPLPAAGIITPTPARAGPNPLQQLFSSNPPHTTRLIVEVREYPQGPGMYGLQVRIAGRGLKAQLAGTTDEAGQFICTLPVHQHRGLTYNVEVTWPRDLGSGGERKAITLNADRTRFLLPFYHQFTPGS